MIASERRGFAIVLTYTSPVIASLTQVSAPVIISTTSPLGGLWRSSFRLTLGDLVLQRHWTRRLTTLSVSRAYIGSRERAGCLHAEKERAWFRRVADVAI